MSDAPSVPWLLLGPKGYLATCTRCGGRVHWPGAKDRHNFIASMNAIDAAIALHAGCLEPPQPVYVPWGIRYWDASDTHTRP